MAKINPFNRGRNTRKLGRNTRNKTNKNKNSRRNISHRTTMKRTKPKKMSINNTLKHIKKTQRDMELDDSPEGIVESLRITTAFVRRVLGRMENQNVNENTKANTSIFLSFLAEKLYFVAENHVALLTEGETKSNIPELYNEERLTEDTNGYVSDFFDRIESEQLAGHFLRVADEYHEKMVNNTLNTMNMRAVTANIVELEKEYAEYASFLQDTNRALWDTIREYGDNLSTSNSLADIIEQLSGLSFSSSSSNKSNQSNKSMNAIEKMLKNLSL